MTRFNKYRVRSILHSNIPASAKLAKVATITHSSKPFDTIKNAIKDSDNTAFRRLVAEM